MPGYGRIQVPPGVLGRCGIAQGCSLMSAQFAVGDAQLRAHLQPFVFRAQLVRLERAEHDVVDGIRQVDDPVAVRSERCPTRQAF